MEIIKMDKLELKMCVERTGSHFFERSSMKFFGDTMGNYYVPKNTVMIKDYSGNNIECWELTRVRPVKGHLQSSAYFDVVNYERVTKPM